MLCVAARQSAVASALNNYAIVVAMMRSPGSIRRATAMDRLPENRATMDHAA
jgi:hypothetical protein